MKCYGASSRSTRTNLLVEGGFRNNLPVEVLIEKRADFVVGVNVSADLAERIGKNVPGMPTRQTKRVDNLETFLRVQEVMGAGTSKARRQETDGPVTSDTPRHIFTGFIKGKELVGETAVKRCLPEIKKKIETLMQYKWFPISTSNDGLLARWA